MVPRLNVSTAGAVKTLVPISHRSSSFAVPVAISAVAKKKNIVSTSPVLAPSGIQISPSLSSILRPAAAQRWMLPSLAAMTPQYVEALLRGAIAGNHVYCWELFDLMIDTDPEIHACVGEYNDGVMNKRLVVSPYREEDDEPSDLAIEKAKVVSAALRNMRPSVQSDENGLKATVRDIVSARFFGQSLLEIDWHDTYGDGSPFIKNFGDLGQVWCPRATYWVHPICYAWSMTGRLGLRFGVNDLQAVTQQAKKNKYGVANLNNNTPAMVDPSVFNAITQQPRPSNLTELLPNKFLVGVMKGKTGSPLSGSDLRCLAWWWVASNFCGDWLLNLAQIFGIPFRKASYSPGTQPNVVEEIKQMLAACGSAGYICLPEGAKVEFERASAGAAESPQGFLFHFADEQKRKVILRQTMTGGGSQGGLGKGGGQAFGNVEADCKAACIQNGADYAADVLSQQLAPAILLQTYGEDGDSECPTVELVDDDEGTLNDAEILQALVPVMDIPVSHAYRKFNIPKPSPGEPIMGVDSGATSPAHNPMLNNEADGYGPPEPPEQPEGMDDSQGEAGPEDEDDDEDDEDGDEKTSADADPEAAESRRALKAGRRIFQASRSLQRSRKHRMLQAKLAKLSNKPENDAVKAFDEMTAPMRDRLEAIQKVQDRDTRVKLLQKFIADQNAMASAMKKDDSLAQLVAAQVAAGLAKGLKQVAKRA